MDTLTVALAGLGGVVLAGVIAHGAWQARRAGPKQASDAREEPITLARAKAAETLFLTSALRRAVAAGIDGPGRTPPELATIREGLSTSAWS